MLPLPRVGDALSAHFLNFIGPNWACQFGYPAASVSDRSGFFQARSLLRHSPSVVIRGITINRVHVIGGLIMLWRVFNHQVWTLYAIVRRDIASNLASGGAAPRKPGLIEVRLHLGHAGRGRTLVQDAGPFDNNIQQHGLL